MKRLYCIITCLILSLCTLSTGTAQWTQCTGIYGGIVHTFAENSTAMFIGTEGGGIYRSTDNGKNWTTANKGQNEDITNYLTTSSITSIKVNGNYIFASTRNAGVYRSSDNGVTWNVMNINNYIIAITINDNLLFAIGYQGNVYSSTDNGDTWTKINKNIQFGQINTLAVSGTTLLVGTLDNGIFRSMDNGVTWAKSNTGLIDTNSNKSVFSFDVNGSAWYAGTDSGGVYRSNDNGASWTKIKSGADGQTVQSIMVSGEFIYVGIAGEGGLWRSTDSGLTWSEVSSGITDKSILVVAKTATSIFVGTDGGEGIYQSKDNGLTWSGTNFGFSNHAVISFVKDGSNFFAVTKKGGLYRSLNTGINWSKVPTGKTDITALVIKGNSLFISTKSNGVMRSTDNGETWNSPSESIAGKKVNCLIQKSNMLFAGSTEGNMYRSTNNGDSWKLLNPGLTSLDIDCFYVYGSKLLTGSRGGVFITTDNGDTWSNNYLQAYVSSFFSNDTTIYACTDGGVLSSKDKGETFSVIYNSYTRVYSMAAYGATLFIGVSALYGESGVRKSTNGGDWWNNQIVGLKAGTALTLKMVDTVLFAGTESGGIYRLDNGKILEKGWYEIGYDKNFISNLSSSKSSVFLGVNAEDVYRSSNNGSSWTKIDSGLVHVNLKAFAQIGNTLFAGTDGSMGVYKSTDDGITWLPANTGLASTNVYALAVSGTALLAATIEGAGIYRSTDNGNTWTAANTGLNNKKVFSLTAIGASVFAGTELGVYRSTDNGVNWTSVNTELKSVFSLATIGSRIFAGDRGGKGLFLSTDNGSTWIEVNSGLGTSKSIYTLNAIGTHLYAGTGSGVFESTNNGNYWRVIGLSDKVVSSFTIFGNTLFAGTETEGLFKQFIDQDITAVNEQEEIPVATFMKSYPNPATNFLTIDRSQLLFNDYTDVTYSLSTLTGGRVMEFTSRDRVFTISLGGIASGVYSLSAVQGGVRAGVMVTVVE